MARCIDAMDRAMRAVSAGRVSMLPRQFLATGANGEQLGVMPCVCENERAAATKIISITPANAARGEAVIQGFVSLVDTDSGRVRLIADGGTLTGIRTAATSALATRELARDDAISLGIFGTGVQAHTHIEAMRCVRDIREVRVWGRDAAKARAFAERERRTGLDIRACERPEDAAAADIVCTVTASPVPVLQGAWIAPGTHVNLVGAHAASARESDSALIAAARVFVDSRAAHEHEGGDVLIPVQEGAITLADLGGELGEVLLGEAAGRLDSQQITVYNSVGVAAQDLFAALAVAAAVD
uniref:Ornithine cyclodeaminase n=1 Tax=Haliea sp. ETY-M TaxID=1055105 RepID=A0A455R1X0_9GAMM|nr:ornithine cyclodeaminase [Haliea sp. ETY-M]